MPRHRHLALISLAAAVFALGLYAGHLARHLSNSESAPIAYASVTYCPETDNSPFFTDTKGVVFGCIGSKSIEIYVTGGTNCPGDHYQLITDTVWCDDVNPAELWGDHETTGDTFIADLDSNGQYVSNCNDYWEEFESFYLKVSQFGLDEWTLAARCCEDCCAAQDVECTSTGEGSSSTWYWDGCDCTQFPVCNVPCTGDDCDEMFSSESNCANAYLSCVDIC